MTQLEALHVIVKTKTDNPDAQYRVLVSAVMRQQCERVAEEAQRQRGAYFVR